MVEDVSCAKISLHFAIRIFFLLKFAQAEYCWLVEVLELRLGRLRSITIDLLYTRPDTTISLTPAMLYLDQQINLAILLLLDSLRIIKAWTPAVYNNRLIKH